MRIFVMVSMLLIIGSLVVLGYATQNPWAVGLLFVGIGALLAIDIGIQRKKEKDKL